MTNGPEDNSVTAAPDGSRDSAPVDTEFGPPGPLRDRLVALIVAGTKTATTSLLADYERENETVPPVGLRERVLDSEGRPVALIRSTAVHVVPLAAVGWDHVQAEGEGHASVRQWRLDHERFWWPKEATDHDAAAPRAAHDDEPVVLQVFELVHGAGYDTACRQPFAPGK